ncbi:Multidrug resistance-associated protein 1 [Halotydeus destructor]|nr:Multidrug resistance-associated protein 1 [Halotydeus destructor]
MLDCCENSTFWDPQEVWYSNSPDFTLCFHKTALAWLPSLYIISASILGLFDCCPQERKRIWTLIGSLRLAISATLVAIYFNELLGKYYREDDDMWISILTLFAFCYATLWMMKLRNHVQTSGAILIYWSLQLFCSIATARSVYLDLYNESTFKWILDQDSFIRVMMYPLVAAMFFLVQIPDLPAQYYAEKSGSTNDGASVLSKFTYYWMLQTISSFQQQTPLTSTDHVMNAVDIDSCEVLNERFEKFWSKRKNGALLWPLFQAFRKDVLAIFLCRAVDIVATLILPIFGDLFLSWLTNRDSYTWHVYVYVFMIFFGRLCSAINLYRSSNIEQKLSLEMRTLLTSFIHQKILKMSPLAKAKYTSGQLSNLAFTDPERLSSVFQYLPVIVDIPVVTGCSLYLLWAQLGTATLVTLISLLSLMPLKVYAKNKFQLLQSRLMKIKDGRAKLISEILNSIKTIKLYAWETPFTNNVHLKRDEEITTLRSQIYYLCLGELSSICVSTIVISVTFLVFCLVSGGVINASNAFVSLSLFYTIQGRLSNIETISVSLAESLVSRKRLISLFSEEDSSSPAVSSFDRTTAISISNASFSWYMNGKPSLEDIHLNINSGSLTAIIGQVGSGKSSLISAILGDMFTVGGKIELSGNLAHVPQTAWIQNATLKKNILFTSDFEFEKYQNTLSACALEDDLKMLPAGDETEIGERGINFSGGQKQRVNLARAVYSDRDIYLLDDTLSAVDANVGNHLFEQVIGPNGLLKNKTRILVTHKLEILPFVDDIVIMKDGRIYFHGSYETLMQQRQDVTDIVKQQDCEQEECDSKLIDKKSKVKEEVGAKGGLVEKEKMDSRSKMSTVFTKYLELVNRKMLVSFVMLTLATILLEISTSLWLGKWVEDSGSPETRQDLDLRNFRLTIFCGIGFSRAVCSFVASYLCYNIALDSSKALHTQMLTRIFQAPMSFFDTTPTGRILNRFTSDVYSNDSTIRSAFKSLTFNLSIGITGGALIILKLPISIVFMCSVIVIYTWTQKKYFGTLRQLQRIESTTRSLVYSQLSETISGSSVIRAYEAVDIFNTTCGKKLDSNNVASYCRAVTRNWMKAVSGSLGALLVLSCLGFVLIADFSASTAGILFGASSSFTRSIVMVFQAYAQIESCLVAVERCQEYTVTPVEENGVEEADELPQDWPVDGTVTFNSYSAKYRPELDLVLKDVDFQVNGGQKVGIVGRTGAGKSSISLALFRIFEAEYGQMLIDDVDCSKIRLSQLRSRLCIIPQDPVLFIGSLRYNLDPFNNHADLELWRALEIANLKDFISQLDGGLSHEISEGGENISVGQRQLVCLARAVLRKSKILVLDEATAAIDNETDEQIQKTIRTEFANCTILTIAHRLNTILDYDKILVMDNGSVAEYDEPRILLKRSNSLFYNLVKDAGLL